PGRMPGMLPATGTRHSRRRRGPPLDRPPRQRALGWRLEIAIIEAVLDATQDEELPAERLAEGRAAWPGISLEPAAFVRRLRELDVRREDLEARAPELVL